MPIDYIHKKTHKSALFYYKSVINISDVTAKTLVMPKTQNKKVLNANTQVKKKKLWMQMKN